MTARRIIFMGSPDFACPALRSLAEAGHEIVAVYCQPPRPAGRGQKERPCPVQALAQERGWPCYTPVSLKDPDVQAAYDSHAADIAIVVAYGLLLPKAILAAPAEGCLNIHASLLPRWRGAAPIQRAIEAGDGESGVTIMRMAEGLDSGPLLAQKAITLGPEETGGTLHDRLAEIGSSMIVETLQDAVIPPGQEQDETLVTYAAKLQKAEARIDWRGSALGLDRMIRAFSPWPGAWFQFGKERIKVHLAQPVSGAGAPGEILDDHLTVACGEGALRLLKVQRAGKGVMTSAEMLRGFALPAGESLA